MEKIQFNSKNDKIIFDCQNEKVIKYENMLNDIRLKLQEPLDESNDVFMAYVENQLNIKQKAVDNKKKKENDGKIRKQKIQEFETKLKKEYNQQKRSHYRSEKDYVFFYNKMLKIDDEMPPYMKNSLENMTQDLGYIYKGIWYFGMKPPKRTNQLTMFERINGIQFIHDYYYDYFNKQKIYSLYEKLDKRSPKTLISTQTFPLKI